MAKTADPFAALDNVSFVDKRDKRSTYDGPIDPRIQKIVDEAASSNRVANLPFDGDTMDALSVQFSAAATAIGKTARIWFDEKADTFKLTVGKRRGRKPADAAPVEDPSEPLPDSEPV